MSSETASPVKEHKTRVVWFNAIGFLVMHLLAVYGLWLAYVSAHFATSLWTTALILLTGESITIGAHRLYTHRSFKATWPVRFVIVLLQTMAGQNCLYIWVRDHRQHHKYSDTDADPHNARRGFFFSHIGWLMVRKHPDVITKGKTIDMSDLEADSLVMFQKRYYKLLYVALAMILPIGVPMIFWNESVLNSVMVTFFLRYVFVLNVSWLVNSAAHIYGTRPYNKDLVATQNATVSILTFGEGWHNYHHAFPWDYRAAEYGQHLNISTTIINAMAKLGMVYDLKEASTDIVKTRVMKHGDGSHPICKEKPESYPERFGEEVTDQATKDDVEMKTTTQRSLYEITKDEQFGKTLNNPALISSQTQQKSFVEPAVLQKIFSDLGVDEDIANERKYVSGSLLKENTPLNNKQHLVNTTRTESARFG